MTDEQNEALIRADELEAIGAESSLARAMAAHTIRLLYKENEALRAALAQPEHLDAQGSPCPEFWGWLPKAYGQTESFSKYNMEVAYLAGKKAQPERAECDGGQCGIGGYCKQCPKTQPESGLELNKVLIEAIWDSSEIVALPQREWQNLTDEEIMSLLPGAVRLPPGWADTVRAIEAKLKEKNNV